MNLLIFFLSLRPPFALQGENSILQDHLHIIFLDLREFCRKLHRFR